MKALFFAALLLISNIAFAARYELYLHCFSVMPPDVYVYRNYESGKYLVVSRNLETRAQRIQPKPQGIFLRYNDGFYSSDVVLAVEFTANPKEDRDAEIYFVDNPNKSARHLKCRPYN